MPLSRRQFLRRGTAAGAALMIPSTLELLFARVASGADLKAEGYGPLAPDPEGLLDLPAGFHYRAFSMAMSGRTDDARFSGRLSNGDLVPSSHDGMAAFAGPEGVTILVRNHEIEPDESPPVRAAPEHLYDPIAPGGTTTLWVGADRQLQRSFVSLAGTLRNCAGGRTPWGSWVSCEESSWTPGALDASDADRHPSVSKRHGYVFEVDAHAEGPVAPTPIVPMGRFRHEALAVDPATGFVYLTEDRPDGLLYRYRPSVVTSGTKQPGDMGVGDLAKGGTLEALRVFGRPQLKTQNWPDSTPGLQRGDTVKVEWVRIPNIDPDVDMERDPTDPIADPLQRAERTAPASTRAQGFALGCAQFARHEGITYHRGSVYVCATNGGNAKLGQVWRLDLRHDQLSLIVEPNDQALLDGPDNITPMPNGDLLICEDGKGENFLVGVTARGRLYHLARNAFNTREFAGACFSPDGRTLFVNMQDPGVTYAIWGPWERRSA